MLNKEDDRKILEVCRKSGPMDENLVRGTVKTHTKNGDKYHADAMRGIKYLQFSNDSDGDKEK